MNVAAGLGASSPEPRSGLPVLQIRGMSKDYDGVPALRSVDLEMYPGEVHALVGHNGAGKSTLIKVLAGYTPGGAGTQILM